MAEGAVLNAELFIIYLILLLKSPRRAGGTTNEGTMRSVRSLAVSQRLPGKGGWLINNQSYLAVSVKHNYQQLSLSASDIVKRA